VTPCCFTTPGTPILPDTFAYQFDDIGNRIEVGRGVPAEPLAKEDYTTNLLNQYSQMDSSGSSLPASRSSLLSYDPDGNLTADARWTYTWNAENRLIAMEPLGGALRPDSVRLEFTYDYQGRRTEKKVSTWDSGSQLWTLSSQLNYLYDGWNLIAEFALNSQLSTLNLQRSYTWGLDLSGSLQGAGGVGGLLSTTAYSSPTSSTSYFPTFDSNGNVTEYLDNTGAIAAHYEYGPFGEALKATGSAAIDNPFRFSTKYTDNETNLLYYGFRYYNPQTGRWLSMDPMEEEGGVNLYGFVDNAPTDFVDTDGLQKKSSNDFYWRNWKKQNPNRDKTQDKTRKETLDRGCIGITCLNLGEPRMPNVSNCFRLRSQAEARLAEMKKNCECSGLTANKTPAEPRLFSTHLYNDTGRDGRNPDVTFDSSGKADLSNWNYSTRPPGTWNNNRDINGDGIPDGGVNFDYGWLNDDGTIQHANHLHDPWGTFGSMKVYTSSQTEWARSNADFNTEVWCVSCNTNRF